MNQEWQPAIDRFREAAMRFVKVVDTRGESTNDQFLASVQTRLLELYSSVLGLPVVEPTGNENPPVAPYSAETQPTLYQLLREKLGKSDDYWTVFDSTTSAEPIMASLAGDISEIYVDLKKSLYLADRNVHVEDTLWEMRFSFTSHWGRHLTWALKAIYDLHAD